MRHFFSLPTLVLSFALCAAPACVAGTVKTQAQAVKVPDPSACPVGLAVERRGYSEMIPVGSSDRPAPDTNQSFDLSMTNSGLQRIIAADIEVHGTSNKSRMLPASGAVLTNEPTADAVRSVHLVSSVPADQTRMQTVTAKDLTSIAWISLIELRYADGSTWHARPGAECRVTPDPLMLVAGK